MSRYVPTGMASEGRRTLARREVRLPVIRGPGGGRTELVPADHKARGVGSPRGDSSWAGPSLSPGKGLAAPPSCWQRGVFIDGAGVSAGGQTQLASRVNGPSLTWHFQPRQSLPYGRTDGRTDTHRAETGCPHQGLPKAQNQEKNQCQLLFQTPSFRAVCYSARVAGNLGSVR